MEKRLLKWFQLAEKWDAVMLIDEADVFLERRSTNDLKRNSLVSGTHKVHSTCILRRCFLRIFVND